MVWPYLGDLDVGHEALPLGPDADAAGRRERERHEKDG